MGTASSTGEFSYTFVIPNSASGIHEVVLQDEAGNEALTHFRVMPAINLETGLASVGSEVTLAGNGFGSEDNITVYLGSTEVINERADKYGNFTVTFKVPELSSHIDNLEVRDESGNVVQSPFNLVPSIILSKTTGHIGEKITVEGTGFQEGQAITISYDGSSITDIHADQSGAFLYILSVPPCECGRHEICAIDGIKVEPAIFTVESSAPPIPSLIPLENPDKVKPGTHFRWEDVSDPSGVIYNLQVATDAKFSSIIFERTALASSEYVITKEDELRSSEQETYYWRVMAVDGASNKSGWSSAQAFHYDYGWTRSRQYMVVAILWAITGFICYRVGKSRRFS